MYAKWNWLSQSNPGVKFLNLIVVFRPILKLKRDSVHPHQDYTLSVWKGRLKNLIENVFKSYVNI